MSSSETAPGRGDLVALLFAMTFPTLAAWLYFMVFPEPDTLPAVYTISKAVQFSFPLAWTLTLGRGRLPRLGVTPRALLEGLGTGLALVLLIFVAYMGLLGRSPLLDEAGPRILSRVQSFGAATPLRYLGLALFLSIIHSLLEEYYWRWFVFGNLRPWMRRPWPLVLSSLTFAGHHVIVLHAFLGPRFWPATVVFSLAVAGGGAVWAWSYQRCRLLSAPWISHMLVDLALLAIGFDLIRGALSAG